jgi:hypothetical protein
MMKADFEGCEDSPAGHNIELSCCCFPECASNKTSRIIYFYKPQLPSHESHCTT